MRFTKVQGLGNDFVIVDLRGVDAADHIEAQLRAEAPAICDRRLGIGADGVLLIRDASGADAEMIVVNFDGSIPEMCGNGLRCVALHVAHSEDRAQLTIRTGAGDLDCAVTERSADGSRGTVRIAMGAATDHGIVGVPEAAQHKFRHITTGNPHAIAFVDRDPEGLAREVGPRVENAAAFPNRTNVEFARVREDRSIELWVWERGVGITQACGTGACATAAAAVLAGHAQAERPIRVDLPGGPLSIEVPRDLSEPVIMTGPAQRVFEGAWPDAASAPA